jgi:hypothetical protein
MYLVTENNKVGALYSPLIPKLYYNYDALQRLFPEESPSFFHSICWLSLVRDPYRTAVAAAAAASPVESWYCLRSERDVPDSWTETLLIERHAVCAIAEEDLSREIANRLHAQIRLYYV